MLLAAVGFFLLSRLAVPPSRSMMMLDLVLVGAGLGTTFPVYMISVQNAFPHRILGVVTSSIQFFRSMGGAIGAAVFGSFLGLRLDAYLAHLPAEVKSSAAQLTGALSDPLTLLNAGGLSNMKPPSGAVASPLPGTGQSSFEILRQAFGSAMQEVYLLATLLLLVSLAIAYYLKEIPLRKSNQTGEAADTSPPMDAGIAG